MPSASSAPTLPFLERLLDGEKVEWKTLGEVAEIGTGSSNRQDETENGSYPFYVRSKNVLRSSNYQFDETAIIIPGEGGIGDIFHYAEGKYALHQRAYRIKVNTGNELVPKFLFYYMTNAFKPFILARCVGATATSIRKPMLAVFPIPIPPLRVQSRIVEILDKFTQLEAELEAELEARNKQYDFYRNRLLDFALRDDLKGQVEWKTLGEMCNVVGRIGFRGYTRNDLVERGEGAISISPTNIVNQNLNLSAEKNTYISWEKYNESPEIMIRVGDIVLVKTGSTIGKVAIIRELNEKATINPQMVVLKEISCLPAYLAYYVCTPNFQLRLKSLSGQGSVPNISQAKLKTIPIPLPPLSEQRRIVDILDRFDTLTNSISEGLPREIALRRKQYEYYRDALLNFPRPTPTA